MKIAFDLEEMKPGCVLLQAAHGCELNMANVFDSKHWLINITPAMHVYDVNEDELVKLVFIVDKVHSG